jgi:hypothetical protein
MHQERATINFRFGPKAPLTERSVLAQSGR